jgi:lactococcin 972 family bacteriocin
MQNITGCVFVRRRLPALVLGALIAGTAGFAAAPASAAPSPAVSASAVGAVEGATDGGAATITGGEGTRIVVDDTAGSGLARTTQRVGGGVWIYGIGGGNSYSYYDHGTKEHASTACAGFGTSCRGSGWTKKGTRSVAKVLRTAWGNTAYWKTR